MAETHYLDTQRSLTTITPNAASWTGCEYDPDTVPELCLFAPVLGDDISNRTGRKVYAKNIRITGHLLAAAGTGGAVAEQPCQVRLVVYQDKQTNGAQSQAEDLLSSGDATNALDMFQNASNFGRFKVWADETFLVGVNPALAGLTSAFVSNGSVVPFKFNIPVNTWINYRNTVTGTVTDVVDNSFHLIANVEGSTQTCSIVYKVRTSFDC